MSDNAEKRPLERMYPLEFPVTVNGVTYTEIPLRRLTAKQVADWSESLRTVAEEDPTAPTPEVPIINASQEVLDALDDDDLLALQEARLDFLPRRLKTILMPAEPSASPQPSGKPTAPSSDATSDGP